MKQLTEKKQKMSDFVVDEVAEAIAMTFCMASELLPSRNIILPHVQDPFKIGTGNAMLDFTKMRDEMSFLKPFAIREQYLEHAFVAYNHEMLTALKRFCEKKKMKLVHEVCCGTGWFAHWMKKYGIPIGKAVDNKTWGSYIKHNNFLPIVKKEDALKFVKHSGDADMIVLSWPYMNPLAHHIWDAMRPGQYLLYIGEGPGGCTADDGFFEAVSGHQIHNNKEFNKVAKAFIQFSGLHDMPELYKK